MGNAELETLSLSDGFDENASFGGAFEHVAWNLLPMIEDALREGTTGGGSTERLGETEGLSDGQVSLDDEEGSSTDGFFSDNDTSTLGKGLIDTTHGIIGTLDLAQEDGLNVSGLSGKLSSVEDSSGSGDDLTTTSMDSVGVKGNVTNVELDASHVLIGDSTLLGSPLEGSFHGILDLIKVLDGGGLVEENVGTRGVGTEAPDLECVVLVPLVLLGKDLNSLLAVLLGGNDVSLNIVGKIFTKRLGLHEDSVVLVLRLGEAHLVGELSDSLLVSDDWVGLLELAFGVLLLEIVEADFDVELTATGNNVLT